MQSPDFKLSQIGVIMLGVQDVARALAFYRDKLGLTVQTAFEGFAFLDGGKVTLLLSEPAARVRGSAPGSGEVVFSVEDTMAAYQALRDKGVQFTHEPRAVTPTMWAANFDDPDGNHLSIFGPQGSAKK